MVQKNCTIMNKELAQRIENLIHLLSLKYHPKKGSVSQIGSYHGKITLTELTPTVCIGAHQRQNHAHVMLFNTSVEEITKDFLGKKHILPLVIITIKQGTTEYVRMKPGKLDEIHISKMGKDLFDTFITLQTLVYKP